MCQNRGHTVTWGNAVFCGVRGQEATHLTEPPKLSIVIPAFNEADRLMDEAARLHGAVVAGAIDPASTQLIVVDDGSSDDTAQRSAELFALSFTDIRVLRRRTNSGKGAAIRDGIAVAAAPIVTFMDADMAVDPAQIPLLVTALDTADVAIGSRSVPGSIVESDNYRRAIMGRTFSRYVNLMTHMGIIDTQCGFKAFRTPVARLLFHCMRIERFAFDVELLYLARRLDFCVTEVPIHWRDVDGSAVRPVVDPFSMVVDVLRMRLGRKPPFTPAVSVSLDPRQSSRFQKNVPATLWDAFGRTFPIFNLAGTGYVVLLPLSPPDEVRHVTHRIGELLPDSHVGERLVSVDQLIEWHAARLLVGDEARAKAGDYSSGTRRTFDAASDGLTAENCADHNPEPLTLPGT